MINGSVVSAELLWQDFGTDGQTDGRFECNPRPAFAFCDAGKNYPIRSKCLTKCLSHFFKLNSNFILSTCIFLQNDNKLYRQVMMISLSFLLLYRWSLCYVEAFWTSSSGGGRMVSKNLNTFIFRPGFHVTYSPPLFECYIADTA